MTLNEIQPNLLTIISGIAALDGQLVLVDDGETTKSEEDALKEKGVCVVILSPDSDSNQHTRGAVAAAFDTPVLVRTNPHVKADDLPTWDVQRIVSDIIIAVMRWSKLRSDFGFRLVGASQFHADEGLSSWLVVFTTTVTFQ